MKGPLDRLPSIKAQISLLIVIAIAAAVVTSQVGFRFGWPLWLRPLVAVGCSLVLVHFVAKGLTAPLRDMDRVVERMAHGDLTARVAVQGNDELARLAVGFNTMAASLADLDRLRRDLLANASHELRTPIAGLRATLENLVDGVIPVTPQRLSDVHAQVERLGNLVTELLDLSRLEAGAAALHSDWVSIDSLFDDAAIAAMSARPGFVVERNSHAGLHAWCDPDRMHQVLVNTLDNAARFSTAARLSAKPALDGGVDLTVDDDGPGIPVGEEGRIFERFYRADQSKALSGTGAGLGLPIARWIVELHGGQIHAAASSPVGGRISITLPAPRP